jgi:hypothetical protein
MEGDLYVFRRALEDGSDKVIVAVNRGKEPASGTLDLAGAKELDLLAGAGEDVKVDAGKATVTIPPQGFAIYAEK